MSTHRPSVETVSAVFAVFSDLSRRVERDDAGRAARELGARAGDLDVAQRLPAFDEARRPARQHVAGLPERDSETAVVEVAQVVDRAIAGAVHRLERPWSAKARRGAVQR